MAQTLAQKLKLKDGDSVFLRQAPDVFATLLREILPTVTVVNTAKDAVQIHWFAKNVAELNDGLSPVLGQLAPGQLVWIFYPKGSSGIQTDLTRDTGWEKLQKYDQIQFLVLISFDDTWSAFALRLKTEADKKKTAKSAEREIEKYADSSTKTIRLPDDLAKAFASNSGAAKAFESLAFSHKREYVEWIVTAKKAETREQRIAQTLERVIKGWKNPRNI